MARWKKFFEKNASSPKNNRKKVGRLLFAVAFGLFFLFAIRLITIVATDSVSGTKLSTQVAKLYNGESSVPARRGTIYDRNGEAIAEDATSYSVYVVLNTNYTIGDTKYYAQEADYPVIAQILNQYLAIDESYSLDQMQQTLEDGSKPFQVEFGNAGKNVNLEQKLAMEEAMATDNRKGLFFEEHPARLYPNGNFASYLIGYAQLTDVKDESKGLEGIMGIEASYNDILQGTSGKTTFEKDHNGNPVAGTVDEITQATDGQDIYTTIDSHLQSYLETLMDAAFETSQPEDLTAVLMKAKTGEIVAMSQRPTYNPQEGFKEDTLYRNLLAEDPFEPGSTMKTMLLAAAINENKFNPYETYNNQSLKLYDTTINDHDLGAIGTLNMSQAFAWSSNIGMTLLEQKLGDDVWRDYLNRFGFGQSTGSKLPNETSGSLPESSPVSVAMSSFGQAISVSDLQMLQAYSAITNHGQMLKPYYISQTVDQNTGEVQVTQPTQLGQVVTDDTASQVLTHLQDVVENQTYGTGNGYAIDGYEVGAKTGTAQIAEGGGYLTGTNQYIYSVMMAAPIDDPEYLLYVTIKKPTTYTSAVLPSITNPLMKRALDLKESQISTLTPEVANYQGQDVETAKSALTVLGLQPIVLGDGTTVDAQSIAAGTSLLSNSKVILRTKGTLTMPDVSGWSKNDLIHLQELLNVQFEIIGQGFAVAQSLSAGQALGSETIRIVLQ